jgi:hypothetical protein
MTGDDEQYDFGFYVEKIDHDDYGEKMAESLWKVSLPHQCGRWRIDNTNIYLEGSTKAEAVEELEAFISQAKKALDALNRGEEHGTDD